MSGHVRPDQLHQQARRLWRLVPVLVIVGIVVYLVVVPIVMVLWGSFRDAPPGLPGGYTLNNYLLAYTTHPLLTAGVNTIIMGSGSALLAFGIGAYLAWVTERTNTPGRRLIYLGVFLPAFLPGVLSAIAWLLLLNPTIGIINKVAENLLGLNQPVFNGYSMLGMIWVQATGIIAVPFLLMAAAFRSFDASFDEASTTAGAGRVRTIWKVTLPLVRPAVLGALLLLFLQGINTFEVAAIIGIPAGIPLFATQVWLATTIPPVNLNVAAAVATSYLAVAVIGVVLYFRATRHSERFATITSRGFNPSRDDLGPLRIVHAVIAVGLVAVVSFLPFLVMVYASLVPLYLSPTLQVLQHLTLDNYAWVISDPLPRTTLANTILVSVPASLATVALASVVSWTVIRTRSRLRGLLDAFAFSTVAFPGTVFALALIFVYLVVPIPVYATLWIIGLGFIAMYIPFAVRATSASMSQIDATLEEASAASGASWWSTFTHITIPLLGPGLIIAFVFVISRCFDALALPLMLGSAGNEVLSVLVFQLYNNGLLPLVSSLGISMVGFLVVFAVVGTIVSRRFRGAVAATRLLR
jgi:iron(III) transport system permease protein